MTHSTAHFYNGKRIIYRPSVDADPILGRIDAVTDFHITVLLDNGVRQIVPAEKLSMVEWRLFVARATMFKEGKIDTDYIMDILDTIEILIGPPHYSLTGEIWSLEDWIGRAVKEGIIKPGEGVSLIRVLVEYILNS